MGTKWNVEDKLYSESLHIKEITEKRTIFYEDTKLRLFSIGWSHRSICWIAFPPDAGDVPENKHYPHTLGWEDKISIIVGKRSTHNRETGL